MFLQRPNIVHIAVASVFATAACSFADGRRPSIQRGVDYIFQSMNSAGNWETVPAPLPFNPKDNPALVTSTNYTGRTALALYALLSCGEKAVDPRLKKAIDLIKNSPPPRGTYALAFRCLALASMPQSADVHRALVRDSRSLLGNASPRGLATYSPQSTEQPDSSNSQVMVLGLAAASECEIEISKRLFVAAKGSWQANQLSEGAWGYSPFHKENQAFSGPHPGMTAAGVATLFLIANAEATASAPRDKQDPHVDKAMAWLTQNINSFFDFNFFGDRSLYCLYALERVGVAGGIKRFGEQSWFERGTKYLEQHQNAQGAWTTGVDGSADATVCGSFALLFLCHADAPAAINKLRYAAAGDDAESPSWNGRHFDIARLTDWIARQSEQKLRWQIVDLSVPGDLNDAPLLYVTGTKPPTFTDADVAAMKAYVDRGGLVVFAPENGAKVFSDAARALGTKLCPGHEWRSLPEDHPIFSGQQFKASRWKQKLNVSGISNGTREFALLVDDDISRQWQAGASKPTVALFELGADILQYTGTPVKPIAKVPVPPASPPAASVSVARYTAADEEAQAWPMLKANLAASASLALNVMPLEPGAPIPAGVKLVHVSVSAAKPVDDAELKSLQAFTRAGGTVLLEARGGSVSAASAVEALVARGWPQATDLAVPEAIAQSIRIRSGAALDLAVGKPLVMRNADTGRLVISRVDLSAGWAELHHNAISGLTPESATAVMALLLKQ